MLFAQIIAFVLVMVVFEAYRPGPTELGPATSLAGCAALLLWFWAGSRLWAARLLRRLAGGRRPADPAKAVRRLELKLNVLAIVSVVIMLTVLEFKAHLMAWGPAAASQLVAGSIAVALYGLHLLGLWSAMFPLEKQVFGRAETKRGYVLGQARFVAPVVFPWLAAVLLSDLADWAWPGGLARLGAAWGDLVFVLLFLGLMALLFPPLVRSWWGCRPLPPGPVRAVAETVLGHVGVRVGGILDWPIMEGRVLTAGILGVAPRLRYLLITPALARALERDELAGVVAHEAGHVRHHHLPLYLLLFLGFFVAVLALDGLADLALLALGHGLAGSAWGLEALSAQGDGAGWLSLALALPLVVVLVLYLRFVMGWFMRHFERQADFFALRVMGEARPLAGALEKVARLSGDIRDLPSWHHFSVGQRVAALRRAEADPGLIDAQGRRVRRALIVWACALAALAVLGQGLAATNAADGLRRGLVTKVIEARLAEHPRDARLWMNLGLLRYEDGDEAGAGQALAKAVNLDPTDPEVLNSLAWLLATAHDEGLRNPRRALTLALAAVRLSPQPHIWDTLAEAYYRGGQTAKAVAAARAAIAAGPGQRRDYYEEQLARFSKALEEEAGRP